MRPATSGKSSAYLLLVDDAPRLLVDAGGGAFERLGKAGVAAAGLDPVLLTHLHDAGYWLLPPAVTNSGSQLRLLSHDLSGGRQAVRAPGGVMVYDDLGVKRVRHHGHRHRWPMRLRSLLQVRSGLPATLRRVSFTTLRHATKTEARRLRPS